MLSMLEAVPWDLLSHGIPIVMCAVILGCLVRMRRKLRPTGACGETPAPAPVFSQEVLLQTLRQQTEQALQRILSVVEAEREKLQPLLAAGDPPPLPAAAPVAEPAETHVPFSLGGPDPPAAPADQSRFAGLKGLSGLGLSPRQIADQMNLPLGEIERVLKLQRSSERAAPAAARQ